MKQSNIDLLNKLLKEKWMDWWAKKMLDENFWYINSVFESENKQCKKWPQWKASAKGYVWLYT